MSLWETKALTERLGTLWNMVMVGEVQIMCNSGSVTSRWFGCTTSCNVWMRQTGPVFFAYEAYPIPAEEHQDGVPTWWNLRWGSQRGI